MVWLRLRFVLRFLLWVRVGNSARDNKGLGLGLGLRLWFVFELWLGF